MPDYESTLIRFEQGKPSSYKAYTDHIQAFLQRKYTEHCWRDHHVNRPQMYAHSYAPFTRSKNDLDRNPDHDQEGVLVYTGQSLFKTTKRITSLFICYISIHLISGLKLSRLRSRSSFYTGQTYSIQIRIKIWIIMLCVDGLSESIFKNMKGTDF